MGSNAFRSQFLPFLLLGVVILQWACRKEDNEPAPPEPVPSIVVSPTLPQEHFGYSELDFPQSWLEDPALQLFGGFGSDIEITDAGATLGRVLFYDGQLSLDGMVSCASCHIQSRAFSDDSPRSLGVSGNPTDRNAMALFNLQYQRRLFWDLRTTGLENQVLQPIEHPDEMGLDLQLLTEKLRLLPYYPTLFEEAYGSDTISLERVANSLAQFVLSMRSYSSRFDEGLSNDFVNFSASEIIGKDIFFNGQTRCNQCHSGKNLFSTQPFINGLELDYAAAGDAGIGALTGNPEDDGRFKTVSLRNVGLTAPYMHDGRFSSLREVVDFYSDDIESHAFLDERFSETGFGPAGQTPYILNLSEEERQGLVDFLQTFNDTVMTTAWWLSDPFE